MIRRPEIASLWSYGMVSSQQTLLVWVHRLHFYVRQATLDFSNDSASPVEQSPHDIHEELGRLMAYLLLYTSYKLVHYYNHRKKEGNRLYVKINLDRKFCSGTAPK